MDHSRIRQKIETGDRMPNEEFVRQHVAFHSIAGAARHDEVARHVRATASERVHMVDGGNGEVEYRAAIHTAAAAVTHHRALERAFFLVSTMMEGFVMKPAGTPRE
jgi:hypothetical protein